MKSNIKNFTLISMDVKSERLKNVQEQLEVQYKLLHQTEEQRDNALTPTERHRLELEIGTINNTIEYYKKELVRLNQPEDFIDINLLDLDYISVGIVMMSYVIGFWTWQFYGHLFFMLEHCFSFFILNHLTI